MLYERYLLVVYRRVCCRIPAEDVEDVCQEVFIAVVKSLNSFRYKARFSTWLRTLVNRQIADYYRGRKPQDVQNVELSGDPNHFSSMSSRDNQADMDVLMMVRMELNNLPEHYREIILLRFVDGLQFSEIAQVQGLSLEATKSLYRRAISALQQRMNDD